MNVALPIVSADPWEDDEDLGSKVWLRRPSDGQRALFKTSQGGTPQAEMELIGSRLAQSLGLSAHTTQLVRHGSRNWGVLMFELPRSYQNFHDLPEAVEIKNGNDRQTLSNDSNIRCMPIFDAIIANGDRHDGNHMVALELSRDAEPRRWTHFLVDHANSFDGAKTAEALEQAVDAMSGVAKYVEPGLLRVREALEYAEARWRSEIEGVSRRFAEAGMSLLDSIASQIPEGRLPKVHVECATERIKQAQTVVESFLEEKEGI